MASRVADPCRFVLCVAVGYVDVLEPVLAFLERPASAHKRDPAVLAAFILFAAVVLVAYFLGAVLVFAICAVVHGGGGVTPAQPAALSPAAVLRWMAALVDVAVKLAVALLLVGAAAYVLFDVVLAAGRYGNGGA
ncbi:hypothetical protein ACP4OV_016890 [Aristida adscensionis]